MKSQKKGTEKANLRIAWVTGSFSFEIFIAIYGRHCLVWRVGLRSGKSGENKSRSAEPEAVRSDLQASREVPANVVPVLFKWFATLASPTT